ncbi:MAG TPA: hypothetical protein VFQ85_06070 [Mycobacteriales bacterium]|nr:hypothetical protein [Mycobacteriales bacterium]
MPNVYALAAHPLGQTAIRLAQEEHKTKGFRAIFGVVLMFAILCGGVWMLLQSSFGPKQAYLISGSAFWGCWLVLSIIWWTGVPGFGPLGIPRSTPQYYGPQGAERRWVVVDPRGDDDKLKRSFEKFESAEKNKNKFFVIDESVHSQVDQQEKAAAEAAAQELAPEEYAVRLGVGAADITIPGVVEITQTELAKSGGEWKYARVTFGPAEPNATDNEPTKKLISRIKPLTFELALESGSLAEPTYWSMLLFLFLFLVHLAGLVRYELNRVPQPQGAPERIPAGV